MKEFKDFSAFSRFLGDVVKNYPLHQAAILTAMAKHIEHEAKIKFGHYQAAIGPFDKWQELADATKQDRIRKGYTENDPLYRTGDLMASVYYKVEGNKAYIGSDSDIMVYQELGTHMDGNEHIPPRPVLGPAAWGAARHLKKIFKLGTQAWILNNRPYVEFK